MSRMLLGTAITKKDTNETIYVEYHRCDKCSIEYRMCFFQRLINTNGGEARGLQNGLKRDKTVEEAFQAVAKMMVNKPEKPDLCFNCQNQGISDQVMLPMQV